MARKPENHLLALPLVLHETLSTIADQLEMAEARSCSRTSSAPTSSARWGSTRSGDSRT